MGGNRQNNGNQAYQPPRARIRIEVEGNPVGTHELTKSLMTIGRLASNDIPVPSQRISRMHARVRFDNGKWSMEDADSLNGIFYQGKRVERLVLTNGDQINLAPKVSLYYDQL
jgi:pSer/pThr/pTyr-binding forkhead associated (FHA) protein